MLLRYAQNVATGHGIVWNVGQHPVDGATDFLTMLLVATLHVAGVGLTTAIRVLDYVSIVALVVVVYATARLVDEASRPVAMAASSLVAVGPTALYMTLGFGTPFFALTVGVATASAYFCRSRPTKTTASVLSISCLVMGLTRPEGVLMAAFLAGALAVVSDRAFRRLLARQLFLWLALPGLAYLTWRWQYFGYPLPNPYYKKGSGHLYTEGLRDAVNQLVVWGRLGLLLFLVPLLLDVRKTWRAVLFAGLPIAAFTASWLLISPELNDPGPLLTSGPEELRGDGGSNGDRSSEV